VAFDLSFFTRHLPDFGRALLLTLGLGVAAIGGSLVVGLIGNALRNLPIPGARAVVRSYIELARNTPLLVQLFFLYFGLPALGIHLSGLTCAILGLTFLGGSYMIESIRSGIEAVRKEQIEAGLSLGLSRLQLIRHVILPQALATALPGVAANCIFLLKETSIVGIIAVPDLMHLTLGLIGLYYKTYESLLLLTLAYLLMILPASWALSRLERRLRYGRQLA
jgi:polar amino acid transport system permease protein